MKFVFLDIDGVLNSSRSVIVKLGPTVVSSEKVRALAELDEQDKDPAANFEEWLEYGVRFGLQTVDPVCVALMNRILEQDDIGLVLSSTHRKFLWHSQVPYGRTEHLRRLRMYLEAMGLHVPPFLSVTPVLHKTRGDEIDQWLNMAWENGIYDDDDRFVIIDDSADMLPDQPLVHVDPTHGFSFEDYAKTCRWLGLQEPGVILL